MDKKDKELLTWALQNSNKTGKENTTTKSTEKFSPELIEAVLGKSDAKKMQEYVSTAVNPSHPLETRIQAFEELEFLVESIDNANDMQKLNLWKPIIEEVLNNKNESEVLKVLCLWVLGTAAQNNPQCQVELLKFNILEMSFTFLQPENPENLRKKAFYLLSSMCKPVGSPGHAEFSMIDGHRRLRLLQDDELLSEKVKFLLDFLQSDKLCLQEKK